MRLGCKAPREASRIIHSLIYTSLLLTTSAIAQGGGATTGQEPAGTIRTHTRLVLVPVVVQDKQHRHVPGLKASDFEVQENGKPQSLALFEEVQIDQYARTQRKRLPPGEYTNLFNTAGAVGLRIIVMDTTNATAQDQLRARQAMLKYLTGMDLSRPTAILLMRATGMRIIHDFTTDPAVLAAAVRRIKNQLSTRDKRDPGSVLGGSGKWADTARPALSSDAVSPSGDFLDYELMSFLEGRDIDDQRNERLQNIQSSLENLNHLAAAFAGIPGKKDLIWLTAAFPLTLAEPGKMDNSSLTDAYQRTVENLVSANISVYPVDMRGLLVEIHPDISVCTSCGGLSAGTRAAVAPPAAPSLTSRTANQSTMTSFAELTGGRAFFNSNDIEDSLKEIRNDESYYMLGYYLTEDKNNKEGWRKLKVKVARSGTEVRSRSGFFTRPLEASPMMTRQQVIQQALNSPVDYTGLPVSVRWTKVSEGQGKKLVGFDIFLAPNQTQVDVANGNEFSIDMVGSVRDTAGNTVGGFTKTFEGKLSEAGVKYVQEKGILYQSSLELAPGTYSVRFVIRDNLSGRTGSLLAPLEVK